jgi:hypothetical protein
MVCYAESVVVNYAVLCLWIMVSNTEPVAVNHDLFCSASRSEWWWVLLCQGCESWCVMLRQCLWIMVSYDEPVLVNDGVLCWAIGYEWWCVMLSKWLWIMVCYAEPVVMYDGVLCWASGWITTTLLSIIHHDSQSLGLAQHTMFQNHWLRITHHDSQPLSRYNTPWFTTTGTA